MISVRLVTIEQYSRPSLGSGITIFNMIFDHVNASFAVDGGSSQSFLHDDSCMRHFCYNVSVYDIQSLTFANHLLDIATFSYDNDYSFFLFDYAVVKDETSQASGAATVASSSAAVTSAATPSPTKSTYVFFSLLEFREF